jgi:short-subunit dehydrogenase
LAGTGVTVTVVDPDFVATENRERAAGADGKPLGDRNLSVQEDRAMSAERCARLIVRAMAQRRREQTLSFRGRLAQWVRPFVPRLIDRGVRRTIERGR